MKKFVVMKHAVKGVEVVKQGWSWPGFFFLWLWALIKGMWPLGTITVVLLFLFGFFIGVLKAAYPENRLLFDIMLNVTSIGVAIFFGAKGNELFIEHLGKRGYEKVGVVEAENIDKALLMAAGDKES